MMTNLTEQWRKGELQNDWYYIRTTDGIEKWEYIKQSHGFGYYETEWVLEVLAPVPSYEEWKNITNTLDYEYKGNLTLREENQQLKELLHSLKCCLTSENIEPQIKIDKSLGKIDEVLK